MTDDKKLIVCVVIGIILGAIFSSMYYVPVYNSSIQHRNELLQDLCNVENERDDLRSSSASSQARISSLEAELQTTSNTLSRTISDYQEKERMLNEALYVLSEYEESYDQLDQQYTILSRSYKNQSTTIDDANSIISEQNSQLSQVSGLMQESYHRGYVDGQSDNSEDSSSIWDLISLIALI